MGQMLKEYFDEASRFGGISARVALARYASLPSTRAMETPDSAEWVERLGKAFQKLKADYASDPGETAPLLAPVSSSTRDIENMNRALETLNNEKSSYITNLLETSKRITETAATALNIARVSVWFLDRDSTLIECLDLFEHAKKQHSAGLKLLEKDFPPYFKALKYARAIDAHDANSDPRTSCFSTSYLRPLGIVSMLDIPIWHERNLKGVLCQEHMGNMRRWTVEEADFGVELAGLISEAIR